MVDKLEESDDLSGLFNFSNLSDSESVTDRQHSETVLGARLVPDWIF